MEIILLEDVRNLGKRGQALKVKPGYARNFLLPQGMALEATIANRALFEQRRKKIDARIAQERGAALEIAGQLASIRLTIYKRVGETETLYGSVTTGDIAEALAAKGVEIDKRRIRTHEGGTIKTVGDHTVTIDLHADVTADIVVSVVPEA